MHVGYVGLGYFRRLSRCAVGENHDGVVAADGIDRCRPYAVGVLCPAYEQRAGAELLQQTVKRRSEKTAEPGLYHHMVGGRRRQPVDDIGSRCSTYAVASPVVVEQMASRRFGVASVGCMEPDDMYDCRPGLASAPYNVGDVRHGGSCPGYA